MKQTLPETLKRIKKRKTRLKGGDTRLRVRWKNPIKSSLYTSSEEQTHRAHDRII